ncbi:MAG: hypothetical protein JWM03_503 [Rhodocyclales bacterium]|nr:hypothetical protein [Rhodocyclales bacterium]
MTQSRYAQLNEQQLNEQQFGLKIRNKLNSGNASLDASIADRLFLARQQALSHHTASVAELSLAGLGRHVFSMGSDHWRPIAAAAALLAFLVCGDYITSIQRAAELEEVDSALLADDLPINAYLDRGFDTWLNSSGQR